MNSNRAVGAVMLLAGAIVFGAGVIAYAIGQLKGMADGHAGFVLGGLLGAFGLYRLLYKTPQ